MLVVNINFFVYVIYRRRDKGGRVVCITVIKTENVTETPLVVLFNLA